MGFLLGCHPVSGQQGQADLSHPLNILGLIILIPLMTIGIMIVLESINDLLRDIMD